VLGTASALDGSRESGSPTPGGFTSPRKLCAQEVDFLNLVLLKIWLCQLEGVGWGGVGWGTVPPTLKLANILNAGTVHEGTPSSDFSIFDPYMLFLDFFFAKLESTTLI
jgi:hypothetical protein